MTEIDTRYGRLSVPNTETDVIGRFLSRYGEWAWCEARFVASVLRDDAQVLDVGAFAGTFGLGVALSRPLGFLCFVEANPVMAQMLQGNVTGKTNCPVAVVEALVVGPQSGPRTGHGEPGNIGATSFYSEEDAGEAVPAPSQAMTLADLRARYGAFDLIKLDVEGMELEALLGDAETLAGGQTTLWIECNEDPRSIEVARLLLSWGLGLYYFAFPSYNPDNFNGDAGTVFPWAFEAGLLAAPGQQPMLTAELEKKGCILQAVHSVEDLRDLLWRTPRWGRAEWENANTTQELAALVGRTLRDETFDTFLTGDISNMPAKTTVWQRLQAWEIALQEASALVEIERAQRIQVEAGLQDASRLAFERLDEIARERARADAAEAQRAVAIVRADASESELAKACARSLTHLSALGELRERESLLADQLKLSVQCLETTRAVFELDRERIVEQWDADRARMAEQLATLEQHLESLRAGFDADRVRLAQHSARNLDEMRSDVDAMRSSLQQMQASTVWRISAPARALVNRSPAFRKVLRGSRSAAAAVLRVWQRQ